MGRSSQRCAACGTAIDTTAVYCPSCGQATGAVVVERLGAGEDLAAAEVSLGSPPRRWLVPAVIATGLVLIGAVVFVGGRNNEPARSAPSTVPATTTPAAAPTTTSSVPSTTTTVYSLSQVTPLPDAAGVVVYVSTNQGDVVKVDIGSGLVERRSIPPGTGRPGSWVVMARQHGYVVTPTSFDPAMSVFAIGDGPDAVPVELAAIENGANNTGRLQMGPAAEPDEVWEWVDAAPQTVSLKRMRIDGTVTAGPVTLPRFAVVLGADGPGAVALAGPGGMYRATIDGTDVRVDNVWPRPPIAYNDGSLLDVSCTTDMTCGLEMVDRASGTSRSVAQNPRDLDAGFFESIISPDGAWLAHVNYDGDGPQLEVYDLRSDGPPISHQVLASATFGVLGSPTSYGFSPDGKWLVFLGLPGQIELWQVGTPQPPVTFDVPGLYDVATLSVVPG